jgi:hypothetical protein
MFGTKILSVFVFFKVYFAMIMVESQSLELLKWFSMHIVVIYQSVIQVWKRFNNLIF